MIKKVQYISFGKQETGGYKHELFFAQQLTQYFNNKGIKTVLNIVRKNKFYDTPFAYLKLLLLGFKANANYNVVVSRVALFALIRNAFNKNKIYIVFHNLDANDGKSIWLKWYYNFLFFVLKNTTNKNVFIVTVAPYWVQFFKNKINNNIPVHYFPNFFDNEYYKNFISNKNNKQIHLGQWSLKNSADIFEIAKQLTNKGYYCYFSTSYSLFANKTNDYDIVYFNLFDDYLTQMASSKFTLVFTAINEGWNRVAHESILVNTPIIAYAKAGLLNLVNESESIAVTNISEALNIILADKEINTKPHLLAHYDMKNSFNYLNQMIQ